MAPQVQTLDDSDPLISYSNANWVEEGTTNEYNNTVKYTNTAGGIVMFTFRGTNVAVYGTISGDLGQPTPQSSYSIDGSPVKLYNATFTGTTQYHQQFFMSDTLSSNSPHSLVIKTINPLGHFYLDFIQVIPVDGVPVGVVSASSGSDASSTFPSSTTSAPSTASSNFSTSTTSAPSTTQPTPKSATNNNTAIKTWGIAVIIVGVLAIVFVVVMVVRRRRRKALKKKEFSEGEIPSMWTQPQHFPFTHSSGVLVNPPQGQSASTDLNTISPYPLYRQPSNPFIPSPTPNSDAAPNGGKGAILHAGLRYVSITPSQTGPSTWGSSSSGHGRIGPDVSQQHSIHISPADSQPLVNPFEPPPPQYNAEA